MQEVKLLEAPTGLFKLSNVAHAPATPAREQPFIITGDISLFSIPFVALVWVIGSVTYPESWWESIIPLLGSPVVHRVDVALGGHFKIQFPEGFKRDGKYSLIVRAYLGPTTSETTALVKTVVIPPFPAVATTETTFNVSGTPPPKEIPEGEWGEEKDILAKAQVSIIIQAPAPGGGDWQPEGVTLASVAVSVEVKTPTPGGAEWQPEGVTLASVAVSILIQTPTPGEGWQPEGVTLATMTVSITIQSPPPPSEGWQPEGVTLATVTVSILIKSPTPPPAAYTLAVAIQPLGTGTVSVSPLKATYADGELVTLAASPASGYRFNQWLGDISGTLSTITIAMIGNTSVVAYFIPLHLAMS